MEFEDDLKLGILGELKFSEWCASAQLTSNRSTDEDKMGWDHLVEFPYVKTSLPRDKQESPIECKVQVKSTQRKDGRLGIKASVLKRLIDYSYPAFIIFIEFSKDCEPIVENTFLVHIDRKITERVLKKIRQNDTLKKPKNLYDIKVSISYNSKHKLPSNSGLAFRDRALSYIPDVNINKYQTIKRKHVETVGYENGGYEFKFNVSPEDFDRYITDKVLGLSESMDVTNSIILDNRFNLKNGSVEIAQSSDAKISIHPNVIDKCILMFKIDKFSPSINFDAEIVSISSIEIGKNKVFFRTRLFSIELSDVKEKTISTKFHLTIEKSAELDEVIKLLKLFNTVLTVDKMIFEVKILSDNKVLSFIINMNHELPNTELLVQALEELKVSYQLDGQIITTVNELYIERDRINALCCMIKNRTDTLEITVNSGDETPEDITIPFSMIVSIGSVAIGMVSLLHGKLKDSYSYKIFQIDVLKPLVFHDGIPERDTLDKLEKEELSKLEIHDNTSI